MGFFSSLFSSQPKVDIQALISEGAKIIDVRSPGEFSGGHYKGSINIPLDQLSKNINKIKAFNKPIIVCCASGMRSRSAKGVLENNGIENVHNGGSWSSI